MTPNLAKAIVAVMKTVKGIEKTMDVGAGNNSYKGVSDQVVKQIIGKAMEDNGLCILPIAVEAQARVDRWEEEDQWSKSTPKAMKSKQSVFTEVKTKYLLMHESGESVEIAGYGHGVDAQDKGAGKATTYALKYALLYAFMVPTGKIDDADLTHSEEIAAPPTRKSNDELAVEEKLKAIAACTTVEDLSRAKKSLTDWQKTEPLIYSALSSKFKQLTAERQPAADDVAQAG